MTLFNHEEAWRGTATVGRLRSMPITICGVGLLGSLVADNLARQGATAFCLIDSDRVEEHNVSQLYRLADIGKFKVDVMADLLFDINPQAVQSWKGRLDASTVNRYLSRPTHPGLVLDCFDNRASRLIVADYCAAQRIPCLHLGLSGDGYGQVAWNDSWPRPLADSHGPPACAVPLARNLALLVVAVATEMIWDWLGDADADRPRQASITLRDLTIDRR